MYNKCKERKNCVVKCICFNSLYIKYITLDLFLPVLNRSSSEHTILPQLKHEKEVVYLVVIKSVAIRLWVME